MGTRWFVQPARSSCTACGVLRAKSATTVIAAAAALELPTAAVLVVDPSLLSGLLFGMAMTPPGEALGRVSGVALLALAVACWPRSKTETSRPRLKALFLFSTLAAAYLFYLGIREDLVGILLWPAATTHAAFAILLTLAWRQIRSGQHGSRGST
jgi:hypothetical protein